MDLACLELSRSPLFDMALIASDATSRVSLFWICSHRHHSFVDPCVSSRLFTRHAVNP